MRLIANACIFLVRFMELIIHGCNGSENEVRLAILRYDLARSRIDIKYKFSKHYGRCLHTRNPAKKYSVTSQNGHEKFADKKNDGRGGCVGERNSYGGDEKRETTTIHTCLVLMKV